LSGLSLLVPVAGIFVLGAVILSMIPVRQAEFGIQVRSTRFSAELARPAVGDSLLLRSSSLSGIRSVAAPPGTGLQPGAVDQLELTAPTGPPITLSELHVPQRWSLEVEAGEDGLVLMGRPDTDAAAEQRPHVQYLLPPGATIRETLADEKRTLQVTKETTLQVKLDHLDIRSELQAKPANLFTALYPLTLAFEQEESMIDPGDGTEKTLLFGTIEGGRLWVQNGAGLPNISLIDRILIGGIENGIMRPVTVQDGALRLGARGTAGSITNVPGTKALDLRPSLLDGLIRNGTLQLLLAIISFFASLEVANVIRRRIR
jgi:hypothetical protein